MNTRIYLSPPHLGTLEQELVREAFASNWIAPLGPHVEAFEKEICAFTGANAACALASGTAAIHLALRLLNVGQGDSVVCSSLTFTATANPILYQGASPVFIDSETTSWNIDPNLLADALDTLARKNRLPAAVISVDLLGQCADYDAINTVCAAYDVPLVQDAAEALGATYKGRPAGTQGRLGIFSFNGNKIITTSGGGMLLCDDPATAERARFLATQARDFAPHYQHSALGYNYRMSNVLAAIGRGQLHVLPERVAARRANEAHYRRALGGIAGVSFMPHAPWGEANRWLTHLQIEPTLAGATRDDVIAALAAENIESRPLWKPLHLQPLFAPWRENAFINGTAERFFANGVSLPSGSALTPGELDRIAAIVRRAIPAASR
ncbi:MAG: aminotransferase class I/II-fold pyridoxal phosphate-dependent enzyme [Puniceicoccales bacterium]|jgi:pyridoxal phosphate-dependent aminotransferase EpsN|nr:aminotransferase class I/II-fold pyridoxal phosphate-dependent enzyme [Puniceicoccales bacterium]